MEGCVNLSESKTQWFNSLSCIRKMSIIKEMANAVLSCGSLNQAALKLYFAAVMQCQCIKKKHNHDVMVSQLFNNISIIMYKYKKYQQAKDYCIRALQLVPKYKKCQARLKEINAILYILHASRK